MCLHIFRNNLFLWRKSILILLMPMAFAEILLAHFCIPVMSGGEDGRHTKPTSAGSSLY